MAPQTVDSDAPPFAQLGKARDLSHANPVCIEIPVTVQGSRNVPSGAASPPVPQPFVEETRTVLAFEQGAVLRMSETTLAGQILILKNLRMNREAACRVVNYKARENVKGYVEVEFLEPNPGFWGIEFPAMPAGRSVLAPKGELKPPEPRLSASAPILQAQQPAAKSPNAGVPLLPDLLSTESKTNTVNTREASPSSLFGWEPPDAQPPDAQPPAAKPAGAPAPSMPPSIEKPIRAATQQARPAEDPVSLSDLLDSLTPLGEQVLLGKSSGPGAANTSLRKTPIPTPGVTPPIPVASTFEKPRERKPKDTSLQIAMESVGSESQARTQARPSPDFESPSSSAEPVFPALSSKHQPTTALSGPVFSAGESEPASPSVSRSRTWLIVVAASLLVAAGLAFGYYRFHSRFRAPVASPIVVTAPAPSAPSLHDVTAPVDTTTDATAPQPTPGATDSTPAPAPTPTGTLAGSSAPTPTIEVAPRAAIRPASTEPIATQPPVPTQAPAPAAPRSAPHSQTPANLKLSSPTTSSTSRTPNEDAPSLAADVPGAIPGGESNGIGGIAQSDSRPAEPQRPSSDFHQPQLISSVSPVYPDIARKQNIEGDVVVDLLVDETGKVSQAQVVSGPALLRQPALDALRKNKYKPATLDGKPASAHVTVTVHFKFQ